MPDGSSPASVEDSGAGRRRDSQRRQHDAVTDVTELVLYSRSYCHLCDDMREALVRYASEVEFDLKIVDVDGDPRLVALYDELVPVLTASLADGGTRQLCHYFLDHGVLSGFFAEEKARLCGSEPMQWQEKPQH